MAGTTPREHLLTGQAVGGLSWHDLKYAVGAKQILRGADGDVSGSLDPAEFCAIMGPSGSGKTTLLNMLSGRLKPDEGRVQYGGEPLAEATRSRIAYVMQEDVLCATQTVREALLFSAALRLPREVPIEEKQALVDAMLHELGLDGVADSLIGDRMIRGISGGEKKRTSIGVELVVRPAVLFLDEPTSGLDSYTACTVVTILAGLARSGCAVVSTIHQPSSEVFALFQRVVVLANGSTFFAGEAAEMPKRLGAHGYAPPQNFNPADHAMYLVQTLPVAALADLRAKLREAAPPPPPADSPRRPPPAATMAGLMLTATAAGRRGAHGGGAGYGTQLLYLAQREARSVVRDKAGLVALFAAPLLLNLLFALIFFRCGDQGRAGYSMTTHFGGITQIAIGGMFGASQPLLLKFPLEAALFQREYSTRTFSASAYFLSKTLVELPRSFVVALLTWAVAYPLMALQGPLLFYVLALWLTGLAASSTALLIGCFSSNIEVALQAAPAIFVPQILFAGFFIQADQIPVWLRWCQYLCSLKYGIDLLLVTEFGPPTTDGWQPIERGAAAALLEHEGVRADDWWLYGCVLLAITATFRVLGILALSVRAARSSVG